MKLAHWTWFSHKNNFHPTQIERCTAGTKIFNVPFSRYGPMWPVRGDHGRWWFFKHFNTKFRPSWKGLSLIITPEFAFRLKPIFLKFPLFGTFSHILAKNTKIAWNTWNLPNFFPQREKGEKMSDKAVKVIKMELQEHTFENFKKFPQKMLYECHTGGTRIWVCLKICNLKLVPAVLHS